MKTSLLFAKLNRMPMLKALVPFIAGILLAERFTLPAWFLAGAFTGSGALALLFRSQVCTAALLLSAGFGASQLRDREPAIPIATAAEFEVTVESIPAEKGRYAAAEALVWAWRDPATGHWSAAHDRILLRTDSAAHITGGERIRCRGTVRPLRGPEGYRKQMARQRFAGSLYLPKYALLERLPGRKNSLHLYAARRMAALGIPGDAGALVRAMTAGDRSAVTPELRAAFSRSGLSHLLAVSGLHAGIIFLLVNAALWWLPLLRHGHILRSLLAAAAVWLFVAAAGFPPSAVRAAVMCTALQFALASGSEYAGLNALATAAFGMLLYEPAWLGDVGFRLSFAAVAGILAWGVPLSRKFRSRHRWLNAVTGAIAVSAAASAATAPLVSHVFGIVPFTGIVATPAALLLTAGAVFAGTLWLAVPLPPLKPLAAFAAGKSAEGICLLAKAAAAVPGGTLTWTLPAGVTAAIYLFFAAATLTAWCAEPKKSVHLPA